MLNGISQSEKDDLTHLWNQINNQTDRIDPETWKHRTD